MMMRASFQGASYLDALHQSVDITGSVQDQMVAVRPILEITRTGICQCQADEIGL
jgi:hypothetical protein